MPGGSTRRAGLSGRRPLACGGRLAVLLGLSLISACGFTGGSPSDEEQSRYTEKAPAIGTTVDYWFYTHCGVENARLGGAWWQAVQPLYGADGPGNPPAGWGNPLQEGRLTLLSPDRATFEARGVRVALVPAPGDTPLRICS